MKDNNSTRAEPGEDPQDLSDDRAADSPDSSELVLVEAEDYYLENGFMVFTANFLLRRGYCCDSGCRHCPYPKESNE